jgi:hypothetical protein
MITDWTKHPNSVHLLSICEYLLNNQRHVIRENRESRLAMWL